ncbi:MAG TPA: hypothetical protein VFZ49_02420 [Pyrinomonadaceae bacterium]
MGRRFATCRRVPEKRSGIILATSIDRPALLAKDGRFMAKNTGKDYRKGSVDNRTQLEKNGTFAKRDRDTGEFMDQKSDDKPFKGVAKEPDKRRKD